MQIFKVVHPMPLKLETIHDPQTQINAVWFGGVKPLMQRLVDDYYAMYTIERTPVHTFHVTLVMDDRAYGGGEEGGWWYNTRTPEPHPWNAQFRSLEAAQAYRDLMLDRIVAPLNKGRRDISSVLSQGIYDVAITRDQPQEHEPATRPHYE